MAKGKHTKAHPGFKAEKANPRLQKVGGAKAPPKGAKGGGKKR